MKDKSIKYASEFNEYKKYVNKFKSDENYDHLIETSFESLNDWSLFYSLDEMKSWFLDKKKNINISIQEIGLNEMKQWNIDNKSGNIYHNSKDFFKIRGLRIVTKNRESLGEWDQPIVEQVGYDGGILGIIRKRFLGVPHYLCEAKIEPGNYDILQISPTLQATFSNLDQKHNGRKPYFAEYFENLNNIKSSKILFDSWLAEDGGRLYKKRNRGILIELPETNDLVLPNNNFCWFSLYQIKQLLKENSWINPHIRGILAHI